MEEGGIGSSLELACLSSPVLGLQCSGSWAFELELLTFLILRLVHGKV